MGTVASNLTRITGAEAVDDASWEALGGGPGSSNSAEIFIQGSEARARRVDNAERGFSFDNVTGIDLDAVNTLVGWWIQCLQPSQVGAGGGQPFEVRVGSNTAPASDWDGWDALVAANYPAVGGWVRIWVAINEVTPDGGAGTPNYAALRHFGVNAFIGNVSGTSPNLICDAIDYLDGGGAALELTGASSLFDDFVSADEGTVGNKYGVWESRSGNLFCKVRSQIGTATSVQFSDSGVLVTFPIQEGPAGVDLVNVNSNGLTFDLQHASTTIVLNDSVIKSEDQATTPGDVLVTGVNGTLDFTRVSLSALRIIDLNAQCTLSRCIIAGCGAVDCGTGAGLANCTIANSAVAIDFGALIWNDPSDPNGELDDMTFVRGPGTTHALELGTSAPETLTLTGHIYSGYNASDAQNDSTILVRRTTGTTTINIGGGGQTPSIKTLGATVVVINSVTVSVTAVDGLGSPVQNAIVLLNAAAGGPLPFEASVTIVQSGGTATVTHTTHGYSTGQIVIIDGANESDYLGVKTITVTGANTYTYPINSGASSPATGTIVSTAVILFGLTNVSGKIEDTGFDFVSTQAVEGNVKKGTSNPVYVPAPLTGNIVSGIGLAITAPMVLDE